MEGSNKVTYTVLTRRSESGCWLISVLGLGAYPNSSDPDDGLPTQAPTLSEVEPMARDLIATYLDVAPDSFDVDVRPEPAVA